MLKIKFKDGYINPNSQCLGVFLCLSRHIPKANGKRNKQQRLRVTFYASEP